jgi:glucosinolate gamma-glutamyl hydrolase
MGVTAVDLTSAGIEFFSPVSPSGSLLIQQHHRREVIEAGQGFFRLAHGNQILMNEKRTILTFQGHPEKDAETARLRMQDSSRWFGFSNRDEQDWARLDATIQLKHEGEIIWRRILEWAREPVAESEMQMGREPDCKSKM